MDARKPTLVSTDDLLRIKEDINRLKSAGRNALYDCIKLVLDIAEAYVKKEAKKDE